MSTTQSLDSIVDVRVQVSPVSAPRATFNEMLVVGKSTAISVNDRMKKYSSAANMLGDGFLNTDKEYLAALLYFAQSPAPQYLWVGRQDVAESCVQALQACRLANYEWYTCMAVEAVKADHEAIALWVETATPTTIYGGTTSDADVLNGVADNLCEYLKNAGYKRTIIQYSTQHAQAIAAILGYAMGQTSGLANSAFTLKFKNEVGVIAEPLSLTQIGTIENNNGNVYLNYGNFYNMFEQGVMCNGQFFDEIINLDMLSNNIQLNVMDLLYGNPKIPQTDAGINQIIHQVNLACDQAATIGFIAPGQWNGVTLLNLNPGDFLPSGYLVQATPISAQSDADRSLRKSPPIYVAVKEAGAVHSVVIGVYVNR